MINLKRTHIVIHNGKRKLCTAHHAKNLVFKYCRTNPENTWSTIENFPELEIRVIAELYISKIKPQKCA